jgi:hypothetical protein
MATSDTFMNSFASLYNSAITAGLPYNLAYDVALSQAAFQNGFRCVPRVQELGFRLVINPNGMTTTSGTTASGYPPEMARMISLFGMSRFWHSWARLFARLT